MEWNELVAALKLEKDMDKEQIIITLIIFLQNVYELYSFNWIINKPIKETIIGSQVQELSGRNIKALCVTWKLIWTQYQLLEQAYNINENNLNACAVHWIN